MRKLVFLWVAFAAFAWVLAACAGPASPAAESTTGVVEPAAAEEPAAADQAAAEPPAVETESGMPLTGTEEIPPATEPPAAATEPASAQAGSTASGIITYSLIPEESSVTYEVGETFINQGNVFNTAVGTTTGVTGDIQVNFDNPQESTVGTLTAEITGFTSDSGRRDNAIRGRYLESSQYPVVTFTPTAIDGLPETIEPGVEYPVRLQGDLTIRDTTRPATFEARVTLQEDALTGQAATTFLMSDFGFGPIDILGMLKTEDEVRITVNFVARPQE